MTDYKTTLNLPTTNFPMKANLPKLEPEILAYWQNIDIYRLMREQGKNRPKFILPDGPPYANGPIHIGHAVNKTLKDMVLKVNTFNGSDAPFVPVWDCHGLPIELNVEKKIGKPGPDVTPEQFRQACRKYAAEQIEIQKEGFMRLGVLGDWQHPRATMDKAYEASIVRAFSMIIANGHLQQGQKPVHFCLECGSALAEAEVEYADKTSHSIDVRFSVLTPESVWSVFQIPAKSGLVSVPIWTTTPWTLPANQAVSVHPELEYSLVEVKQNGAVEYLILAQDLLDSSLARYQISDFKVLGKVLGKQLEKLNLQHPFLQRSVPVILGEHVTTEAGTGAVHTAPAHGMDDFIVGMQYNLPLDNPVGSNGCYLASVPFVGGQFIRKADPIILDLLAQENKLLNSSKLQHSYPHCWRHKTPLIFMSTPQWFISMDQNHLRDSALQAIKSVRWIPDWGQVRIHNMIANRPDWCISRQRTWGVPMCLIVHKETRALHPRMTEILENIAQQFEQHGLEAWYNLSVKDLVGADHEQYEKISDTLEVWFESGVLHYAVLKQDPSLSFPADLFLEGSDQHRGWFQSSLLTSCAMYDVAPYRTVLTHGFTVDAQGRKMSKSVGNVIAPEKIFNALGADILRLWIASTDYSAELGVSDEILKRTADTYRRLRNTIRFMLANIYDFDPKQNAVPIDKLLSLDYFILAKAQKLQKEIVELYLNYQFHQAMQKLHHFCSIDLSSFYLDVIKDRQYTCQANSHARRSTQTTMFYLAEILVRLFAPVLSFTAEEIWRYLPNRQQPSVFLATWTELPALNDKHANFELWEAMLQLRVLVNKELENARAQGKIGSGLNAEVTLFCAPNLSKQLSQIGDELRFVLITSSAKVQPLADKPADAVATENPELFLLITPSTSPKCQRCWHHRPEIGHDQQFIDICDRCISNVHGKGETRQFS